MRLIHGFLSVWNIFSAIQATILRLPCTKFADFKIVHHDKTLKGVLLRSETGLNDAQCMVKCIELNQCQSYNINIDAGICELNSESERGNVTKLSNAPGWLYKTTDFSDKLVGFTCKSLQPCSNNMQCRDTCTAPFYECIECNEKHNGLYCEKTSDGNKCQENICKNGTCVNTVSGYECLCSPGFTGKNCETDIDECFSLPCLNGGICENLINQFKCTCFGGYTGISCEEDIDECQSMPCMNGGTCINMQNEFKCQCLNGVFGMNCDSVSTSCKELKTKYPNYQSGLYGIDGSAAGVGTLTVFCDMETDGGGWTQVLNVSSKTNDFNAFKADILHDVTNLAGFKADKKYGMTSSALKSLKKVTGYKQFRMKCQKSAGNKLMHIKTTDDRKGYEISEYLTYSNSSTKVILVACNTFIRMSDDNSRIGQHCEQWRWDNDIGKERWLMDHLIYIHGAVHWNIGFLDSVYGLRYECDSYGGNQIGNGDFWKIYVK